ncbi:MAG TPA: amidohydrolase family protein [Terracidiphilus sp.]|nr:amidohydrolase family protein [Terracidiphilus sp.]
MPRIDAHQHFWRYDPAGYGWIDDRMAALKRDFLPPDLLPLLQRLGFDGCIAVQACHTLDETLFLLDLAHRFDFIRGVVGWVDLCSPDVASQLEPLARDPKLVGIRHVVQAEPDDEFMLRADFRRGIGLLAEFGLAYDILVYPRQLRAARLLVDEFPEQRFVLDHIAKPLIAEGVLAPWRDDVRSLAAQSNLFCKLSGMVTEAQWNRWSPADFRPYLDVVFEAFGPQRLMIGSDWPVCTLAADYRSTMQIVLAYISKLPVDQQDAILGGNCPAFYRLAPNDP